MRIAVASGKGGTGKTTVAVNLAKSPAGPVVLADCDVEEPNAHLFLSEAESLGAEDVTIPVPCVDTSRCDGCGECGRFCRFNAIVAIKTQPMVFPELCHGCGGCAKVCPQNAITEVPRRIGDVERFSCGPIRLVQGRLDVGVAMAPPLIRAVQEQLPESGAVVLDAPPGTSCPVVASLRQADAVILVTEPTPFGLHDLKLAAEMVRELKRPFGVVVNRAGAGDARVHDWCRETGVPVLAEIPDDRRIAELYSRGVAILDELDEYRPLFEQLFRCAQKLARTARTCDATVEQ